MENLSSYGLIIIFSLTIILSYFFNLISSRSGVPSVLMLILLGMVVNFGLNIMNYDKPNLGPILEILGVVGLILIVLEAALDLELVKNKIGLIVKSFAAGLLGLAATAFLGAVVLQALFNLDFETSLLFTIPLSVLSSAIIIPSLEGLSEYKKEFMIYESTFSDILGIVAFYSVLSLAESDSNSGVYGEVAGNLLLTVFFAVIISYVLIYIFQNLKGHAKLFLLISVLLLLYAVGKIFHLSPLIIILMFGVILNNYSSFFRGGLSKLIKREQMDHVLGDFKVITAESAFVVRTFFFIIFGWSVSLISVFNLKVILIGFALLVIIYLCRAVVLFSVSGKKIIPQLYLAPRGLISVLLFYKIPPHFKSGLEFEPYLLFIIIATCLVMSWSLIRQKNKSNELELVDSDLDGIKNDSEASNSLLNEDITEEVNEEKIVVDENDKEF